MAAASGNGRYAVSAVVLTNPPELSWVWPRTGAQVLRQDRQQRFWNCGSEQSCSWRTFWQYLLLSWHSPAGTHVHKGQASASGPPEPGAQAHVSTWSARLEVAAPPAQRARPPGALVLPRRLPRPRVSAGQLARLEAVAPAGGRARRPGPQAPLQRAGPAGAVPQDRGPSDTHRLRQDRDRKWGGGGLTSAGCRTCRRRLGRRWRAGSRRGGAGWPGGGPRTNPGTETQRRQSVGDRGPPRGTTHRAPVGRLPAGAGPLVAPAAARGLPAGASCLGPAPAAGRAGRGTDAGSVPAGRLTGWTFSIWKTGHPDALPSPC